MSGDAAGPPSPIELAVVVPVHNGGRLLADQLRALAAQDYDHPWELVVVDDGSTDGSRELAASFSEQLPLRTTGGPDRRGPAHARNVGAAATTAEKLLFVDADDEVAPGYLAAMSRALDRAGLVAPRIDHTTLNPDWIADALGGQGQVTGVDVFLDFLPAAAGTGLGVRRDVFDAVGGFDESLRCAEDIAFCWEAQLRGTPLDFAPDAVVRYRHRRELADLYRQTRTQGRWLPRLFRLYGSRGMPRRVALRSWAVALALLVRSRGRAERARAVALLGYRIGRLEGSIRHRTLYL